MKNKKTTINLTPNNWEKIQTIVCKTKRSQTDIINQAISGLPVIVLGDQKLLAESFFDLRKLIEENKSNEFEKEVIQICQSLNLLIEKIQALTPSETE